MYIMRRTQLYLEENLWKALHIRSQQSGISISELVRQAVREKYGGPANRKEALRAWVGAWKERNDLPDSRTYVRRLRKGGRLRKIAS